MTSTIHDARTTLPSALDRLRAHWAGGRFVCMGLDPQLALIDPTLAGRTDVEAATAVSERLREVVDATADLVAAYKPNLAFFEALGPSGWVALEQLVAHVRSVAPDVLVVADCKRGDNETTMAAYASNLFDRLGVDSATVHPYLGEKALEPVLSRVGVLPFVVCRTSNPGAGEFQDLTVAGEPLYTYVARQATTVWAAKADVGLVAGGTDLPSLEAIRRVAPTAPLLIPGLGAQGGDLAAVIQVIRATGEPTVLVSSSRGLLHPYGVGIRLDEIRAAVVEMSDRLQQGLL